MNKKTNVVPKITRLEFIVGNNMFVMQGDKIENIFEAHFGKFTVYGVRLNFETLSSGLWLDANVVVCWGAVLNHEESSRSAESKSRHFFLTGCISKSMFDGTSATFDAKWKSFSNQVNAQFKGNKGGLALEGIDLSYQNNKAMNILDNSPGTYDSKYKQVCDLLKKLFARHLKEYGHIRHAKIAKLKQTIPKLKWKTKENFHNCEIFTMLHMETFNGGPASSFECGLPAESLLQRDMLRRLRFKFVRKILLHEINVLTEKMLELAKEFDKIDHVEKMAIIVDAFKNLEET
nr:hypothetical protein [Tanacetum cinerariifolium]